MNSTNDYVYAGVVGFGGLIDSLGVARTALLTEALSRLGSEPPIRSGQSASEYVDGFTQQDVLTALRVVALVHPRTFPQGVRAIADLAGKTAALHPEQAQKRFEALFAPGDQTAALFPLIRKEGFAESRLGSVVSRSLNTISSFTKALRRGKRRHLTAAITAAQTALRTTPDIAVVASQLKTFVSDFETYCQEHPPRSDYERGELKQIASVANSIASALDPSAARVANEDPVEAGDATSEDLKCRAAAGALAEVFGAVALLDPRALESLEKLDRMAQRGKAGSGALYVAEAAIKELVVALTPAQAAKAKEAVNTLNDLFVSTIPNQKGDGEWRARIHGRLDKLTLSSPAPTFTPIADTPGRPIPELSIILKRSASKLTPGAKALARGKLSNLQFEGIELLKRTEQEKQVRLKAKGFEIDVTWQRDGRSWKIANNATVRLNSPIKRQIEIALMPELRSLVMQATLSMSQVERVIWSKREGLAKVELSGGGFAIARSPNSVGDPRGEYGNFLLHQAANTGLMPPVVLLKGEGGAPMSFTAEVPGFKSLYAFEEAKTLNEVLHGPHAQQISIIDCIDLIADEWDSATRNIGVDGDGMPQAIDREGSFSAKYRMHGIQYRRRKNPTIPLDEGLAKTIGSWTSADLERILAPAHLEEIDPQLRHQYKLPPPHQAAYDRLQYLFHLAKRNGQISLGYWNQRELDTFLRKGH